jgi:hypothetical protein
MFHERKNGKQTIQNASSQQDNKNEARNNGDKQLKHRDGSRSEENLNNVSS